MPQHLSTIYVDTRENERPHPFKPDKTVGTDMLDLVLSHRDKPPAEPKFLLAGDFYFVGNGPKGPSLFGIERKRTKDMLASIRLGRFSGEQLPKLLNHYDFIYLVIEGRFSTNWYTGVLEERYGKNRSAITFGPNSQTFVGLELLSWMNSITLTTPLKIIRTRDEKETVEFVVGLNHTFSKPWDKHTAHIAIHQPQEYATIGRTSTVRRVAYTLSGVGWDRSGKIEQHFSSVADMVSADISDWKKVEGIGKVLADRIYKQLHGLHEPTNEDGII